MKIKNYILFICFVLSFFTLFGQELLEEEKAMFKEARKAFFSENYDEAVRLFSHLSSVDNQNATYQYYLGVSFLKAKGENNKAIDYLEFASKNSTIPQEVFFYLAKAYHLGNRFEDAISTYTKYKAMLSKSDTRIAFIDRQIEMCNNAKTLVAEHQKVLMTVKKEVENAPAYGHYDVSMIGGKVIKTPDHYKSKDDVKENMNEVLFMAYNKDILFYSSKEEGSKNGQEIIMVKKLPDGEWGLPQSIGEPINTMYDEDAPFLHPDGKTLYFSSKGHNSMGGFDIFRSEFIDEEWPKAGYWTQPENLGYPINSSDDDQFFVTDFDQEYAYFSSGRETSPGKMEVFKIKLPKKSIPSTVIKGIFTNNNARVANKAKITVFDKKTEALIGVFNTDPMNGQFLLILAPDKEYTYLIEAEGFTPRVQDITIPPQFSFYELYQEINLEGTKTAENLAIVNDFSNPYVTTINDEELAVLEEKTTGAERLSNSFAYSDKSKLKTVELGGRMIVTPSYDNSTVELIEEKELPSLALARQEKLENSEKTTNTEESSALLADEVVVNPTEIISEEKEKVYGKGEEYEKVSHGTLVFGEEDNVENVQLPPSISIISAYADELRSSAQQNALDAEIAFANSQEIKSEADKLREEAVTLEKVAYEIKNEKKKEEELEKVREIESKAREQWQEARESYDYAQNLQKESELKSEKAKTADATVLKIKKEQEKSGNTSEDKYQYTDLQLQEIQLYTVEFSEELRKESNLKDQKAEVALNYAQKIRAGAQKKMDESSRLAVEAEKMKGGSKKESLQQESLVLQKEAEELAGESEIALTYSNELKSSSEKKLNESILLKKQSETIQQNNSLSTATAVNKKVNKNLQDSSSVNNIEKVLTKEVEFVTRKEAKLRSKTSSKPATQPEGSAETVAINTGSVKSNEKSNKSLPDKKKIKNTDSKIVSKNKSENEKINDENSSSSFTETNQQQDEISNKNKEGEINDEGVASTSPIEAGKGNEISENNYDEFEENFLTEDTSMYEEDAIAFKQSKSIKAYESVDNKIQSNANENKTDSAVTPVQDQVVAYNNSSIAEIETEISSEKTVEGIIKTNENVKINANENKTDSAVTPVQEQVVAYNNSSIAEIETEISSEKAVEGIIKTNESVKINANENSEQDINENENSGHVAGVETNSKNTSPINENNKNIVVNEPTSRTNESITTQEEIITELVYETKENETLTLNDTTELFADNFNKDVAMPEIEESSKNSQKENEITNSNNKIISEKNKNVVASEEEKSNENLNNSSIALNSNNLENSLENSGVENNEFVITENETPVQQNSEQQNSEQQKQVTQSNSTNKKKGSGIDFSIGPIFGKKEEKKSTAPSTTPSTENQLAYNETPAPVKSEVELKTNSEIPVSEKFKNKPEINSETATGTNPITSDNIPANTLNKSLTENPVTTYNVDPINIQEVVSKIQYKKEEKLIVFSMKNKITYSEKKPIPVNEVLPEGLIFKVQIGAFKNPIPQNLFGGINPIMAETTPMGFKRYSAGIFRAYESANLARNEIRNLGFKDAFVVSFFNGKRITLSEALAILKSSSAEVQVAYKEIAMSEKQALAAININDEKYADASNVIPVKYELPEGTYFKVQIGAFSNPVSKDNFPQFNVKDISGDLSQIGLIRYTVGLFNDYASADNYRKEFVIKHVPDAFVVVYRDGERVPLSEVFDVKSYLAVNNTSNSKPAESTSPVPITPKPEETIKHGLFTNLPSSSEAPVFMIQIGSYKNGIVPKKFMDSIEKIEPLYSEMTPNGYKRFLSGKYENFNSAEQKRDEYRNNGISDAYVVAYYNKERITIPEAEKILENLNKE